MEKVIQLLIDRSYDIKQILETPESLLHHIDQKTSTPPDWNLFNNEKEALYKELNSLEKAKMTLTKFKEN